jgi:hypothetical protein
VTMWVKLQLATYHSHNIRLTLLKIAPLGAIFLTAISHKYY